jgi:hypothetical protein
MPRSHSRENTGLREQAPFSYGHSTTGPLDRHTLPRRTWSDMKGIQPHYTMEDLRWKLSGPSIFVVQKMLPELERLKIYPAARWNVCKK